MTDVVKIAHCMCGDVQITMTNPDQTFAACHCDMCKRWTGMVFHGVPVANDDLVVTGPVARRTTSDWAERANCKTCGSPLWYKLTAGPNAGSTNISLGLFDDTEGMTLDREYYVDRKTSAHIWPEGRTQMTEAQVLAFYMPAKEGTVT